MVWALAQQRDWLPAHEDETSGRAVAAPSASRTPSSPTRSARARPARGSLRVALDWRPGLDAAAVQAVATAVGERLATDGEIRARIDGLAFSIS